MIVKEFTPEENDPNMIDMKEEDIKELIVMTKGYSGADLKALSTEAAMMPLREITDVQNCDAQNIRPLRMQDFVDALKNVRATVDSKLLQKYLDWNDQYGSYPITAEDLKD